MCPASTNNPIPQFGGKFAGQQLNGLDNNDKEEADNNTKEEMDNNNEEDVDDDYEEEVDDDNKEEDKVD